MIPPSKGEILDKYEELVAEIQDQYDTGLITQEERHEAVVEKWNAATDEVAEAMVDEPRRPQPHLHDGQLGCPWLVQADPPAGGHARPDGKPEGRDHRASDQGQLHGGPVGARVLHLDARRAQGTGRHRAAYRRLGLPDAASGRRRAGRDHPRGRLRHQGVHRARRVQGRRRRRTTTCSAASRPRRSRPSAAQCSSQKGKEIDRAEFAEIDRGLPRGATTRAPTSRVAGALGAQVRGRPPASARPATAARWRPARPPRSATRWASSPPSRSASRARS